MFSIKNNILASYSNQRRLGKEALVLGLVTSALLIPLRATFAAPLSLATRLQGQILLQVQSHGEAWYVNPKDQKRYYMKDGASAYQMMRSFGQGISEADYTKASSGNADILKRIKGLIVLRVAQHGEAYYVNPKTLKLTYLKDGEAAYGLMREQGQGITNSDVEKIATGLVPSQPVTQPITAPVAPSQTSTSTVITPTQVPSQAPTIYCTTASGDCAGFKVKIDFDEDATTCDLGYSFCKYNDKSSNTKQVYYLTVRSDTVKGKVTLKNLNSGTEQDYHDLLATDAYEPATGKISFFYGYYRYPNIKVDFRSTRHEGTITADRFVGTYQSSGLSTMSTSGTITYLPITLEDKIPRKDCVIKGDTYIYSGGKKTYYTSSSASYSSVSLVESWFCSEDDAVKAGYQKSLR